LDRNLDSLVLLVLLKVFVLIIHILNDSQVDPLHLAQMNFDSAPPAVA
jgi:hypothetical protein